MDLPAPALGALVRLGAVVGLALSYVAVARVGLRRARGWQRVPAPERPVTVGVRLAGDEGTWVQLGSSIESAESVSGSPTLTGLSFSVLDDQDRLLSVSPSPALKITAMAGARRTLIETLTRADGGVDQRYGFEVVAGTRLWLRGRLSGDENTPFGRGAMRVIEPMGDALEVYGRSPGTATAPDRSYSAGCLTVFLVLVALAAMPAALFDWEVVWWIAMGVGVLVMFGDMTTWPGVPPESSTAGPRVEPGVPTVGQGAEAPAPGPERWDQGSRG